VYDVTEFLPVRLASHFVIALNSCWSQEHPGGSAIILKYAGRDATSAYEPIHPPDALEKNLPPEKHLGDIDNAAQSQLESATKNRKKTDDELRMEREQAAKPSINRILNLQEMEVRFRQTTGADLHTIDLLPRMLPVK